MKPLSYLLLLCLVAAVGTIKEANATLISMDSAFGSDTITQDTDTNLLWLDVTLSTPYSYTGVLAELGAGGVFDGYRVANNDEVRTLFTHAGIPVFGSSFVTENYDPVLALMGFVGVTGHNGNLGTGIPFDYTVGHADGVVPSSEDWIGALVLSVYEPDKTARASAGYVPIDNTNPNHGTWLVATTSIPEPGTLFLLGAGLMILGIYHRRKAQAVI